MTETQNAPAPYTYHGDGWKLRYAAPEDNGRLCELFRSVHLEAALDLTQEREPDFFALLRMHGGEHETWVAEGPDGRVEGCGSLAIRPGWVAGEVRPVGYLCDLRGTPVLRKGRVLPKAFRIALEWARARHGVDCFYTVVIDSSSLARRALTEESEQRKEQPVFKPMTPFQMTSAQFVGGGKRPEGRTDWVRPSERSELVDFLRRRNEFRLFGEVVDDAWLTRRLSTWPGLALEHFVVAKDSGGRIVGCTAPYDTESIKRSRVLGYHGSMRLIRIGLDALTVVCGGSRLPKPGECFRFEFLSHLEADDPRVLADLLCFVYRARERARLHFVSAMIPTGSALTKAFRGFVTSRTGMTVYGVALRGSEMSRFEFRTPRPGFELALN
ncbi:MAG: hypothetical protein HYV07_05265 [Deltaproteobacteria bacterium]|nr:hypothetical protein [Deltaproteobacteria bacterium]